MPQGVLHAASSSAMDTSRCHAGMMIDDNLRPTLVVVIDEDGTPVFECSGAGLRVRHPQEWQAIAILRQLYVSKGLRWPCP